MSILQKKSFWFAFVATLACSLAGKYLALLPGFQIIGALVLALLFGMLLQVFKPVVTHSAEGVGFISNKFLRLGIILLGFRLNLKALAESGVKTIVLACVVVTFTILVTYYFCRLLKVEKELAIMTASGCGICGAAAVMGISPQIKAKKDDAVLAVAVVAILGTVFTLIEIGIAPMLHMTDVQYGVMNGASLHEIAHAVAAGGARGGIALEAAIITKLSRVLLLVPAAIFIGIWYQKQQPKTTDEKSKLPIPWFMLGFLATSAIGSFFPIPAIWLKYLVDLAYIVLGMAMAGLGMSVNFNVIVKRGGRVLLAATASSILLLILAIVASKLFF